MTTPETPLGVPAPPATPPIETIPKKASGLALAALFVGIGAFLFGLIPVFGALVGITGIVLGVLALTKKQSKGLAVTGIVLAGLAVLASVSATAGIGAVVNNVASTSQSGEVAEPAADEPIEEAEEPAVEEEAVEEEPATPAEYLSALTQAVTYSEVMYMSKQGLYDQLVSEYGGQFSKEAAKYAVDNVGADWNANALEKAKSYQSDMALSPEAIRDQLTSEYGEKFTKEEADYAIKHLND